MNKLRRIFKSEDVVKIADAVKIPDCVVRTEPVILPESTIIRNSGNETPDIEQSIHDENISEDSVEDQEIVQDESDIVEDDESYDEKQESIAFQEKMLIEREAFIKQAQTEAAKIIEEAEESKKRIIEEANHISDKILEEARLKGYAEGEAKRKQETEEYILHISEVLEELKQAQEEYFDDYAAELKLLSLEIAEKVIAQKLSEEPSSLFPLIRSAVKSIREVNWIKVEISDKFKEVAADFEKSLSELKPEQSVEVELRRDANPGTCVVHTSEGVTIATVKTQLENIREYFMRYKDSEDDEAEARSDETAKKSET